MLSVISRLFLHLWGQAKKIRVESANSDEMIVAIHHIQVGESVLQ